MILFLAGCGPSAEQIATMTAAAWTPTPVPTPTATPIPYDLTVHIADESGAPIAGASLELGEPGSSEPVLTDQAGQHTWMGLGGPAVSLNASAPGYHPAVQVLSLERGPSEIVLILQRDPLGLLTADACAPDEQVLYMEDYQDGKGEGWQQMTAALDFNAQNGWSVSTGEDGDQFATFSGGFEGGDDLQNKVFDNLVWRLNIRTHGTDGFSFLNLRHAPKQGGETRYTIQWGANALLALARLDFPDVGHFDVGRSQFRAKQDQWYYVEASYFQGLVQIWVDGKKQIEWQDPQPLPPGTIGLEAHAPNDPNTMYFFDDLSVCELSAPFSTSMYKTPAQ